MTDKTNHSINFLPKWVWAIVLVQIILVLFFSAGTAMNPGEFLPGVSKLDYLTQLYLTRNVTVALGLVVALYLKSHKALFSILVIRLLTDMSDAISVYAFNVEVIKSSVPMVVILLIIPALVALGYLWKRINQENKQ